MTTTKDLVAQARECGATFYKNRHSPHEPAVAFSPTAWEKFTAAQAQRAEVQVEGCRHGIAGYCTECNRACAALATRPPAGNAGEREALLKLADQVWLNRYTVESVGICNLEAFAELIRADALATKRPAGEQKPVSHVGLSTFAWGVTRMVDNPKAVLVSFRSEPTDDDLRALHEALRPASGRFVHADSAQPEQVAQDSAVLAFLDDLKDDAAAHIWPDDLERCQTSECVVEVTSVRMGSPDGKTVPLFSREQVAEAIRAARARGEVKP